MHSNQQRSLTIIRKYLAPADREINIRTYYCTKLSSRLFGLKADGFLSITNKRVIFYGIGSSFSGKSVLQSEIPISEISGITAYKGTYFSFKSMLVALLLSFLAGSITFGIISGLIAITSDFNINALHTSLTILQIISLIIGMFLLAAAYFIKSDKLWKPIAASAGLASLATNIGGYSLISTFYRTTSFLTFISAISGLVFLLGLIYFLRCIYLYARQETLALAIGAKGGNSTPITIAGVSELGLYNVAALKSLTARPTKEAMQMLQELGAMIMDIQSLGDIAIKKWKS